MVEKKFDSFHLKLIAIIGMLINHIGILFEWSHSSQTLPFFAISEFVGRFTFPIMAYLLVEGFHYTRNIRKYILRMVFFWVVSIYPFYLLHNPDYAFSITDIPNNIFFTLLMGLIMLTFYVKIKNVVGKLFLVLLFIGLTILSDWNIFGIILIWAFYQFHDEKGIKFTMLIYFVIFEILAIIGFFAAKNTGAYVAEMFSALGFLAVGYLLLNYNGKRGYAPQWIKWGFYLFYPLHLTVLEIIKYVYL
ncbi:TraX family protein [Lactobacillus sp. YT155]|uniref:TraX family protein n=1 Tax=Lactobacillus sp. YT155 TaxID=3060955 RepID=UPI00265E3610|nr:TraX family protein [Lactobacillus sp. YT155]MDO1604518.1 TraX family protein [Lactobacillus sp. YT155]